MKLPLFRVPMHRLVLKGSCTGQKNASNYESPFFIPNRLIAQRSLKPQFLISPTFVSYFFPTFGFPFFLQLFFRIEECALVSMMLSVSRLLVGLCFTSLAFAIDTLTTNGRHFVNSNNGDFVHPILTNYLTDAFSFGSREWTYGHRKSHMN